MPGPLAVLDANVIFPFQLRNFLFHLATSGIYKPLWSEEIVSECSRHLLARGIVDAAQLGHLIGQMRRSFPEAWGVGYEWRIERLVLPDPGDRHVAALAVQHGAEMIVTMNLRDFPAAVLAPLGVTALPPDDFVERLIGEAGIERIANAAEAHRLSLRRAPLLPAEYLDSLRRCGLARTADALAAHGFAAEG